MHVQVAELLMEGLASHIVYFKTFQALHSNEQNDYSLCALKSLQKLPVSHLSPFRKTVLIPGDKESHGSRGTAPGPQSLSEAEPESEPGAHTPSALCPGPLSPVIARVHLMPLAF